MWYCGMAEAKPERVLATNVEYYAAAVPQPALDCKTRPLPGHLALAHARRAATAHVLEQASANRLIRPNVRYVGPADRDLPA